VLELRALGQAADLSDGCDFAAHHLGADPAAVLSFVRSWDEGALNTGSLLRQLEEVWGERLADAEAVQHLLHGRMSAPVATTGESPHPRILSVAVGSGKHFRP
jgi:hypothetical protein